MRAFLVALLASGCASTSPAPAQARATLSAPPAIAIATAEHDICHDLDDARTQLASCTASRRRRLLDVQLEDGHSHRTKQQRCAVELAHVVQQLSVMDCGVELLPPGPLVAAPPQV